MTLGGRRARLAGVGVEPEVAPLVAVKQLRVVTSGTVNVTGYRAELAEQLP